jgi:hypothetical protein
MSANKSKKLRHFGRSRRLAILRIEHLEMIHACDVFLRGRGMETWNFQGRGNVKS